MVQYCGSMELSQQHDYQWDKAKTEAGRSASLLQYIILLRPAISAHTRIMQKAIINLWQNGCELIYEQFKYTISDKPDHGFRFLSHACCVYTNQSRFCIRIISDVKPHDDVCHLLAVCLYS